MYSEIDRFLAVDTWYTPHPSDTERFMHVLHELMKHPDFNPDAMGEYMRNKLGVSPDDADPHFSNAVDRYVCDAWAVKEYFKANGL